MFRWIAAGIANFFTIDWLLWCAPTTNNGQLSLEGKTFFTLVLKFKADDEVVSAYELSQKMIDQLSSSLKYQIEGDVHSESDAISLGDGHWLTINTDGLSLWMTQAGAPPIAHRVSPKWLETLLDELEEYTSIPEVRWERAR